ncbi:MAG TPA: peptide chain release factor 1 [Planctomycetota bacterium]|nr:peptide chain release factor 1 [Planctomycetota bacterium]
MEPSVVVRLEPRLKEMSARLADLDRRLADPATAQNPAALQPVLRERAELAKRVAPYEAWRRTRVALGDTEAAAAAERDPAMAELYAAELAALRGRLAEQERDVVDVFLKGADDGDRDVILEVRAGTGGDEAALWAADLLRMYVRYAERRGWTTELLSESATDLGGLKEAVIRVAGDGVYDRLRFESGGHRVQRVPDTEQQGRIHTSAATVAVLPEVGEVEVEVKESDLRIDAFRASGAGGQHVNKTSSAIRLTHLPSGLVVACQDERSQHKNKARALAILRARLYDRAREEQDRARAAERKEQVGSGDRSERIRTYNFPQSRVTDHRINLNLFDLQGVLDGDLDDLLQPLVDYDRDRRLKELVAGR